MLLFTLAIIGLWPTVAEGVVPRWRSATGFRARAGVVPRAGVVVRGCAILDAASTNDTMPGASEPNRDGGGTVASARIVPSSVPCSLGTRLREGLADWPWSNG